jgi:NADPH-dependent glutamate synthase beta subunit-like oxidoreductase
MGRTEIRAPCTLHCPAGIDAPRYVRLIAEGRFREAAAVVREKTPFPLVLGYACFGPCERFCSRGRLGQPLAIRALKRFAAERDAGSAREPLRNAPPTGRKVAIVGSGPGGLTAAYYLARRGHAVTVFERHTDAGGMLRVGIPEFRLPRHVVDSEIREIQRAGVRIRTSCPVHSRDELFDLGYRTILLATGLPRGRTLNLPGIQARGVLQGLPFLRAVNEGRLPRIGANVLVIGGGNVAVDVARSAIRLGASVSLACLERRPAMPAHEWELHEAEEEGLGLLDGWGPAHILAPDGAVTGVNFHRCVSVLDPDGRFAPRFDDKCRTDYRCDTVILAIGQRADGTLLQGLERTPGGQIAVVPGTLATSDPRVFACGDLTPGSASIVEAIGGGRRSASEIDRALGGTGDLDETLAPDPSPARFSRTAAGETPRIAMDRLPIGPSRRAFRPVELGFSENEARQEAERCLRCDHALQLEAELCILCGKCQERCSFDALVWRRLPPDAWRLTIHDDLCLRCNDCVTCCPSGALRWRSERRSTAPSIAAA